MKGVVEWPPVSARQGRSTTADVPMPGIPPPRRLSVHREVCGSGPARRAFEFLAEAIPRELPAAWAGHARRPIKSMP